MAPLTSMLEDAIESLLGEMIQYHEDNPHELLRNDDLIDVIALMLHKIQKRSYLQTDTAKIARLNSINWKEAAITRIEEYIEYHRPDADEE